MNVFLMIVILTISITSMYSFSLDKNSESLSLIKKALEKKDFPSGFVGIKNKMSDKCMGFDTRFIVQKKCDENDKAQMWRMEKNGDHYNLVNALGKHIENRKGRKAEGNTILGRPKKNNKAQKWTIKYDNSNKSIFNIINHNGNCIDSIGGLENGSLLKMYGCEEGVKTQSFSFEVPKPKAPPKPEIKPLHSMPKGWFKIQSGNDKLCMSYKKWSIKLLQDTCKEEDRFFWKIEKQGNGYVIVNKEGGNVIENSHGDRRIGSYQFAMKRTNKESQIFQIIKDAEGDYFTIKNIAANKCINISAKGPHFRLNSCNNDGPFKTFQNFLFLQLQ